MIETAPPPMSQPPQPEAVSPGIAEGGAIQRIIVVTGMSGAGRSTALKALEDMGYEAVDNLPLSLLPALVGPGAAAARPLRPTALGIDVRTRDFGIDAFRAALAPLSSTDRVAPFVLFLDCDDELLGRRYTETRRRHPLAVDRPVMDGIRLDRQRVSPLRERADLVIDTSALTAADLRRLLRGHFALDAAPGVTVSVTSFSYRHGLPREADLVFDVRFLENPHYLPALRPLTGRDGAVGDYIRRDPGFAPFFDGLTRLLMPLLPRYEREGKSYLTIAVGCTGGKHRSVFVAESLADWLAARGVRVGLVHRELDRALAVAAPGIATEPPAGFARTGHVQPSSAAEATRVAPATAAAAAFLKDPE